MGGCSLELPKKRAPVCLDWERYWAGWVVCPRNQWERGRWLGNISGIVFEPQKTCLKAPQELSRKKTSEWSETGRIQIPRKEETQCGERGAKGRKRSSPFCIQVTCHSTGGLILLPFCGPQFPFLWMKCLDSALGWVLLNLNFCSQNRSREKCEYICEKPPPSKSRAVLATQERGPVHLHGWGLGLWGQTRVEDLNSSLLLSQKLVVYLLWTSKSSFVN